MKLPSKNQNGLFICEECGRTYLRICSLSRHIGLEHNKDDYYEKYLKEENEEFCPVCGNFKFDEPRWDRGYKRTCSEKCANIFRIQQIEKTCIEKYGVKNVQQRKETFDKQQRTAKWSIQFKNTSIHYRASYELDFLENYYHIYSDMKNAPTIKYMFNKKRKVYFPDFYIPSLNLIVEIKNSYLAKRFKTQLVAKKKATIANGFNFIMITDKHYNKFNNLFRL
jgi:hypothetical protein